MVVKHVENVDIVDAANTFDKDIFDKKDCDTCAWWTNNCQHPLMLSNIKLYKCCCYQTEEELSKELMKLDGKLKYKEI